MNIIINAVLYHDKPRGVGNYFDTLLETLLSIDTTNQYFVFYGKWMTGYRFKTLSNPNLHLIELNIPRNKLFRNLYLLLVFPFKILKFKPNVLHNIDSTPIIFKTCKTISTIHDIAEFLQPEKYSKIQAFFRRLYVKLQVKLSDQIITVSNYSKKSLHKTLSINSNKINVIYNSFENKKFNKEFNNLNPYILCVGELEKTKNFEVVIKALELVKSQNLTLKIVGRFGNDYDNIRNLINASPVKNRIQLLGYVDSTTLDSLYKNAYIFVFPSIFEGFGIPLIEAMSYKLPIISSNATCLPEIGGTAALYFEPKDEKKLSTLIDEILNNQELRNCLVENGNTEITRFSKINSATAVLNIYKKYEH